MKIIQGLKRLSILLIFILSTLLFTNVIPSFADGNLNYYYNAGNQLIFTENTVTGRIIEYHYDGTGNLINKGFFDTNIITATAESNGSISPSGITSVKKNSSQTFTLTPASNYVVEDVLVDGVSVGAVTSYTFSNVTANHTISVSFIFSYTVTATAASNGSISSAGTVIVPSGHSQTFTITPDTGYVIADVRVDGASVGAVSGYTFSNVVNNHTINAIFVSYTDPCIGGLVTNDGAHAIHTFTSSGEFYCATDLTAEVLVVAGGGSGANSCGGGGGGGGVLYEASHSITAQTYTITVGAGGNPGTGDASYGGNGGNSVFDTMTAIGGGGGGHLNTNDAQNGGSGGGGGNSDGAYAGGIGTAGPPRQGYNGGRASGNYQNGVNAYYCAGGGGGAGEAGHSAVSYTGGIGGIGVQYPQFAGVGGSPAGWFAGGGGGYGNKYGGLADTYGGGGYGKGGSELGSPAANGVDNTGGGGGGGVRYTDTRGGSGGSGIVIVRYLPPLIIGATAGSNGSITPSGVVPVQQNDNKTFTIRPDTGYIVADVQVDGVSVGAVTSYTFSDVTASHTINANFVVPKPSLQVTIRKDAQNVLTGVKTYLFNDAGNYLGLTQETNSSGVAAFEVSAGKYKVRADYLGYQFWSNVVSFPETVNVTILIPTVDVKVNVTTASGITEGVKVYLFTAAGSYLGVYSVTDSSGSVTFKLPVGSSYKVRSDIMGNQYWSNVLVVSSGGADNLAVDAGGGVLKTNILQAAGVPLTNVSAYLFNSSGSYLGLTQKSDAAGAVNFTVPQGTYKVRADYLGYQFWSGATAVSSNVTTDLLIAHKDVGIVVNGAFQGTLTPLSSLNTYLFTSAGSYMSKTLKTDTTGKVVFSVPQKAYKVRADYMSQQYWSEEFTWVDKVINIPMADAVITMVGAGMPQANLPVYVFSAAKSYLGITAKTNAEGKVTFRLPAGMYKFRADYQTGQFWSTDQTLTADQSKDVTISTGGSNFNLTVKAGSNPLPGVQCYVFNDKSAYLGVSGSTDDSGKVVFALSDGSYKFRVDYLGYQFWSGVMTVPTTLDLTMAIPMSAVVANVGASYGTISNVTVYLFSESGSYLGLNAVTDAAGNVTFNLPAGCHYKLRYDILGNQYWSDVFTVAEGVQNNLILNAGGGTLQVNILKAAGNPLTGVTAYLFNQNGTYLGSNQTADAAGKVAFSVPNGTYKMRVDYLGYQFWSGDCIVSSDLSTNLIIPHKDVTVTVGGLYQGSFTPIADISTYLFDSAGSYMGKTLPTDTSGSVIFNLPEKAYKVRADYMSQQYWSDEFTWLDNLINIPMADAVITMTGAGMPRADIPVYIFSSGSSYLGVTGKTGSDGKVTFRIPGGSYKFRADYQTNQFWTDVQTIVADQVNYINLSDGGGNFTLTVKANTDPLVGVNCYVFNDEGSYLGLTGVTNSNGQYSFELSTGNYKIRVDYLGYQFWTNVYSVPTQQAAEFAIELFDTPVTVNAFYRTSSPLSDLNVYLFTQAGAYVNVKNTTDSNGGVVFSIPNKDYKIRVDYLGRQFWADIVSGQSSQLQINEGLASIYVHTSAGPVTGAKVYLFSESDSYLGVNATTDTTGHADFTLPAYPFKFRIDFDGAQYWSEVINIIEGTQSVFDANVD